MKCLFLLLFLPLCLSAQSSCLDHNPSDQLTLCSSEIFKSPPSVVRLFPNPTMDLFQITGLKMENTEGVLFDISGRKIRVFKLQNGKENDISDLANAIYFLIIEHEAVFKIIKQ
jgi:Secretion system C-terminal sorting domain